MTTTCPLHSMRGDLEYDAIVTGSMPGRPTTEEGFSALNNYMGQAETWFVSNLPPGEYKVTVIRDEYLFQPMPEDAARCRKVLEDLRHVERHERQRLVTCSQCQLPLSAQRHAGAAEAYADVISRLEWALG